MLAGLRKLNPRANIVPTHPSFFTMRTLLNTHNGSKLTMEGRKMRKTPPSLPSVQRAFIEYLAVTRYREIWEQGRRIEKRPLQSTVALHWIYRSRPPRVKRTPQQPKKLVAGLQSIETLGVSLGSDPKPCWDNLDPTLNTFETSGALTLTKETTKPRPSSATDKTDSAPPNSLSEEGVHPFLGICIAILCLHTSGIW